MEHVPHPGDVDRHIMRDLGFHVRVVVEDEIEIARVVRDYLRNAGFEVIVVGDGGSAVASVRSAKLFPVTSVK